MKVTKFAIAAFAVVFGMSTVVGSLMADESAPPAMELPPGWTAQDMQACMEAGVPGKMHEHLAKSVGVWKGKTSMWMTPGGGGEPTKSECTSTVTSVMDGRYIQCAIEGEMPGMGPYKGMGIYGYDNVSQKFMSTWYDNASTGLMQGTGKLSADGKVMTWEYTYSCPINKKPAIMREVETITGPNSKTLESWTTDPKSGKEYKMMVIEFTK